MQSSFNVNEYWLQRGRNYLHENLPQEFHRLQETFLIDVLRSSGIPLASILEVGCGFGRITRLLASSFQDTKITALDLSPEQLENAKRYCGQQSNISFQQYDLYSGKPFPGAGYDIMVAIEVFLHHPRPIVLGLFRRLAAVASHLINIDWSEHWPWKTAEHVWVHDYSRVYREAGLQCATFVLPEKVDGKQQKLFVGAKTISPAIRRLEEEAASSLAKNSTATSEASLGSQAAFDAACWPQDLELAMKEILRTLPSGWTFILVNDDLWGNESRALNTYRVLPFIERDGQYWGPPVNDGHALSELQRLQREGASHIVFAWNSFWWLDHYRGLHEWLRLNCTILLETPRVKIFRLPPSTCA